MRPKTFSSFFGYCSPGFALLNRLSDTCLAKQLLC